MRSIVWFDDAEELLPPESLDGMTWLKVKRTIIKSFDDYNKTRYKN